MKFKVKEGMVDGSKFVKTISERNDHEIVQRAQESVEEDWNRIELAQSDERVGLALKALLSDYKGDCK